MAGLAQPDLPDAVKHELEVESFEAITQARTAVSLRMQLERERLHRVAVQTGAISHRSHSAAQVLHHCSSRSATLQSMQAGRVAKCLHPAFCCQSSSSPRCVTGNPGPGFFKELPWTTDWFRVVPRSVRATPLRPRTFTHQPKLADLTLHQIDSKPQQAAVVMTVQVCK